MVTQPAPAGAQTTQPASGPGTDQTSLALPAHADIRRAAELHQQCSEALAATGDVTVDCGSVEWIDAAVLQCLAALAVGLYQGDRQLVLVDQTPAFDRAVELLDLESLLPRAA